MRNLTRRLVVLLIVSSAALCVLWYWRANLKTDSSVVDNGHISKRAWAEVRSGESLIKSSYSKASEIGKITDKSLNEISGTTASRINSDVWWVHNDSGDVPRIFAVNSEGTLLATYRVVGAINEDWEDIAIGPAADGSSALYIADIGDNELRRNLIVVYRVKEPDLSRAKILPETDTESVEPLQFKYPDGKHDAEAIIVDPESGRIYIITKTRTPPCQVFRSPWPLKLGEPMILEPVTGAAMSNISQWQLVTGAAVAPDGSRIVIRTYFNAFELLRLPDKGFESVFDGVPTQISLPLERQGEAITYSRDGKSLITISEQLPTSIYQLTSD